LLPRTKGWRGAPSFFGLKRAFGAAKVALTPRSFRQTCNFTSNRNKKMQFLERRRIAAANQGFNRDTLILTYGRFTKQNQFLPDVKRNLPDKAKELTEAGSHPLAANGRSLPTALETGRLCRERRIN